MTMTVAVMTTCRRRTAILTVMMMGSQSHRTRTDSPPRMLLVHTVVDFILQWLIYIAGDGLGYGLGFRSHSCSWQLGLESESDSV